LLERPRREPNLKNRVGLETEDAVVEISPPHLPNAGGDLSSLINDEGEP
jgi:hypothetical protein